MGSRVAFGRYTLRSPVRVCLARWPRKRRLPGLTSEFAAGHHGDVSKCDGREECPDRRDNRLAHHDQENYGTGCGRAGPAVAGARSPVQARARTTRFWLCRLQLRAASARRL